MAINDFNEPHCINIDNDLCGCFKKAEYILQYKLHGIDHNDTFCRLHAHAMLSHLRDTLGYKVKIFELRKIEKEKVQFT